jgi:hypothetical protein
MRIKSGARAANKTLEPTPFDGPFWREHSAQDVKANIPAYLGAYWGQLWSPAARPRPARITIHHDESHPSHLDLPITRGNIFGTFFSGGDISKFGLSS